MLGIVVRIGSLLAGIAILLLGHGLTNTLLALRAAAEGYSDGLVGAVMAAYFAGFILGTFVCPPLINRVGHIRVFAAAAGVGGAVVIFQGLFVHPGFWVLGRLLFGLCVVAVYMVVESWLNRRTDNTLRGRVFAVYNLVNLAAMAGGQLLLWFGDVRGLELFALGGALFCLGLVPVALTRMPEPEPVTLARLHLFELARRLPLAAAAAGFAGAAAGALLALGPLFARQAGLSDDGAAAFMAAAIAGGALLQWPIGRWSDHADRRRVLAVTAAGAAAIAAVLGGLPGQAALLLPLAGVYGGLAYTVYPLGVALANDRAAAEGSPDTVGLSANLLLAYGLGATVGPLLAGGAMELLGRAGLPLVLAACWSPVAALASWRRGPASIEGASSHFVITTRTTPVALEAQIEDAQAAETASASAAAASCPGRRGKQGSEPPGI